MIERETNLFEALRLNHVERLRFVRKPEGIRQLAAVGDGAWCDAASLLPSSIDDLRFVSNLVFEGGHERLDLVFRAETGLRFICAVHSTARGPGAGGLRRRDLITTESEVIVDALDLSRGMTYKNIVAEIARGGSKLVVHGSPFPDYERSRHLEILAEEINLSGTITGPDVGFPAGIYVDLAHLSTAVTGIRGGGTAQSAAAGVHVAVNATLAALGIAPSEAKIAVQGLGALGTSLATGLARDGAKLVVTDLDHRRIDAFLSGLLPEQRKLVGVVAPYQILEIVCDVFSPCAIGRVVSDRNATTLRCRAICGGANNQLDAHTLDEELRLAKALTDAGVLYVPDWIASAGGTIHGTMEHRDGEAFDSRKCLARVRRTCGWILDEILEAAKRSGRPPLALAAERFLR